MIITDLGQEYRVCDKCGERFYHDSGESTIGTGALILTGYENQTDKLHDLCTRCAAKQEVDVCHGSCMRWFRKAALNDEGECCWCEGERIATQVDNPLITGAEVTRALINTHRNYERVTYLISEAIVLGITLSYAMEVHSGER